ncbi:hypothetical protein MAR_021327 [Mya arenaria]|uniref:Uncharacterized protein n=1 Tax=Mya arenaria TaxID=6604 RepID=A0ABY7E7B9_MYAAR|nr:hypothetical protein MAR_021327 [Mya arenaria]
MSAEIKDKVKLAPKTSIFGQLDHTLRTKPNMTTLAAESCIIETGLIEKGFQICLNKCAKSIEQAQEQKIESGRLEKLYRQQEIYIESIINHGLWQSQAVDDNMILTY